MFEATFQTDSLVLGIDFCAGPFARYLVVGNLNSKFHVIDF